MSKVVNAVHGMDAIHVRTCRASDANHTWTDHCGTGKRTRLTADEAVSFVSLLNTSHAFIASDDPNVLQLVQQTLDITTSTFEGEGRVIHIKYRPADVTRQDVERVVLDWMAPIAANRVYMKLSFWQFSYRLSFAERQAFAASCYNFSPSGDPSSPRRTRLCRSTSLPLHLDGF